jgi:hypothetical protein
MFPLCAKCAEELNVAEEDGPQTHIWCKHSVKERQLTATWVAAELHYAVRNHGYVVQKVYETWVYTETMQFDGQDMKTGLFNEYLSTFMRLKHESSGWPPGVVTREEKLKHLDNILQHECIRLDIDKIIPNKMRRYLIHRPINTTLNTCRYLSKLFLNSLWGKLTQNAALQSKTQWCSDGEEFFKLTHDPSVNVRWVELFGHGDNSLALVEYMDDQPGTLRNTNAVLGAMITAYGTTP